jgi:two-component system, OmpR family, response regulator RegX3
VRILVVEDDRHVGDALELAMRQHGHEVIRAATGAEAVDRAAQVDLVLLDFGLPDLDGIEVCRRIRQESPVLIIAVTARGDELDRVLGLQAGADDYMVKPYGVRELLARIEAVSRRAGVEPAETGTAMTLTVGRLRVETRARRAFVDGQELRLTRKEFDLLAMLAANASEVCERESIISDVWDENWFGSTRTLDVHVGALRNKLGDPSWIETVRGVGFRLVEPGSDEG